ncbi:MarR family transcriptional regulator [Mycolicibacterium sp. CH28]|uniref:MarR family winged helix-turn-helix transcriptional regulator n=1 Tax=Mycolicibacterium sp. CH28 TaxID=2512237 RepID=UPI001081C569|nr:MarR family transcriptional regulator [Mycolicibacterium sp. CH28]TGD87313.1 MarR family transcriptional regulator [Mycolicibacterium sp. CH28]
MSKSEFSGAVPSAGVGKRGEEGHLGYLLRQANVAFRSRLERALAEFGVTQPQFAVLTMVDAYPGCSSADLARLSLLTPQTVTVIVANLRRDGLLTATPHPVHGRIRQLALADRGRTVLADCKDIVGALEAKLAAGLSRSEADIVRRWLVQAAVDGDVP